MGSSASESLRNWIAKQLDARPEGFLFPTDQDLAGRFGVSVSTVRRAMTPFQKSGRIERRPGKGTFIPREEQEREEHPVRTVGSVDSVAELITAQIRSGQLRKGYPIPSIKRMALEWHVASSTVTGACRKLCTQGLLTRIGRSYVVGGPPRGRDAGSRNEILALHPPNIPISRMYTEHMFAHTYRSLEYELLHNGCEMHYASIDDLPALRKKWKRSRVYPYGILFTSLGIRRYKELKDTIRAVQAGDNRPKMLIVGRTPRDRIQSVNYFHFGHANTNLFRVLADFLAERDFSRVVICTKAKKREDAPVTPSSMAKLWVEMRHHHAKTPVLFNVLTAKENLRDTLRSGFIYTTVDRFTALLSKYTPTSMDDFAQAVTVSATLDDAIQTAEKGDAWVFLDASLAAKAWNTLSRSRALLARNITVLSLENNPDYFDEHISVCAFDFQKIGYLMAHALIGDLPVAKSTKGYVDAPILVLERRPASNYL